MRAKNLRPTKRMIQAYRNAVELQWSSDLSKIVSTWAEDIRVVWEEARALDRGTNHVHTHPINRLYASKLGTITGGCKNSMASRSFKQALALLEENGIVLNQDTASQAANTRERRS